MKFFGVRISLVACLAMVSLQTVGAHLHVDTSDHHGTLHHEAHFQYSASADDYSNDHDGHLDVSFQNYAPKFSNVDNFVIVSNLRYEIVAIIADNRWFGPISKAPPRRNYQYKPPLRAPPARS